MAVVDPFKRFVSRARRIEILDFVSPASNIFRRSGDNLLLAEVVAHASIDDVSAFVRTLMESMNTEIWLAAGFR